MKKFGKIIAVTAAAACVAGAVAGLAACSGGSADIENTYIVSELVKGNVSGVDASNYTIYRLNIMDDGTYELIKTTYIDGFNGNLNLGNNCSEAYGTYTAGETVDGYTAYTLNRADRVIVNSYSLAGGFDIHIDSATAEYPVEMPAEEQGEKNMAQSADDVIDAYGAQMTVYVSETGNILSLTNPNA